MPINSESEQDIPSCSVFSAKQWGRELFFYLITRPTRISHARSSAPAGTGGTSSAKPRKSTTQQNQDPPAAVQMPPQNPPAPQANDGARGEFEVLTEYVFMSWL